MKNTAKKQKFNICRNKHFTCNYCGYVEKSTSLGHIDMLATEKEYDKIECPECKQLNPLTWQINK